MLATVDDSSIIGLQAQEQTHTQHGGDGESMTIYSQHFGANFPFGSVHHLILIYLPLATDNTKYI